MFQVNNKNTRTTSVIFIVNSEHISSVSIVDFEQVNVSWVVPNEIRSDIGATCYRHF